MTDVDLIMDGKNDGSVERRIEHKCCKLRERIPAGDVNYVDFWGPVEDQVIRAMTDFSFDYGAKYQ